MFTNGITRQQMLEYEIASSPIAEWVSWDWGQTLVARYYSWKVNRKGRNYDLVLARSRRLLNNK